MPHHDPGPAFVAAVREALMVDDAFAHEERRGFSWWAHRLRQRIAAGEPRDAASGPVCRVRVETDVALSGHEEPRADAMLCELVRFPPLSGFVRDAAAGRLRLVSSFTVGAEPPPHLAPLVAVSAALQATYAELGVEELSLRTGLAPAFSHHPKSGPRPHPDGMLDLAAARIVPAGEEASRWAVPDELVAAAEAVAPDGTVVSVDPRGFTARFPFRSVVEPLAPRSSALLQVRVDAPHPELGHGVFLRLFLPTLGVAPIALTALRLNALEHLDDAFPADGPGSWTLERSEPEVTGFAVLPGPPRLAYVLFLPNLVKVPGMLKEAALAMSRRAARAATLTFP